MKKKGKLVVLSGPSGCGKNTVFNELNALDPNIVQTVSATTRAPREGEQDGVDYYYITEEAFLEAVDRGEFLEYVRYGKNLYGTLNREVERLLGENRTAVLIIEVNGARNVKLRMPEAITVFLLPPSLETLRERLLKRGQDTEEEIDRRLAIAEQEMEAQYSYDHCVVNDDLMRCVGEVYDIIRNS